jgi:hypothetical protein
MGWDNEMDEQAAEIAEVLNRMHRHSRPRARIGVLMMIAVDGPKQGFPMEEPVDEVEMGFTP